MNPPIHWEGGKAPTVPDKVSHYAFSDESHWNVGRYRSIGLVSLPCSKLLNIEDDIQNILSKNSIKEFKWSELQSSKERFAAIEICKLIISWSLKKTIRVDILEWDIKDSRHSILKRDDCKNLQLLYYHLFSNVMRKRWPGRLRWALIPDEHTSIDWETIDDCLSAKGDGILRVVPDIASGSFKVRLCEDFFIDSINPSHSEDHPLIQIADLFAGLAVFSREQNLLYKEWIKFADQPPLFKEEFTSKVSSAVIEKCKVLHIFNSMCKSKKMGVSLEEFSGLKTFDPENPINFWWWTPQSDMDKAPVKEKS